MFGTSRWKYLPNSRSFTITREDHGQLGFLVCAHKKLNTGKSHLNVALMDGINSGICEALVWRLGMCLVQYLILPNRKLMFHSKVEILDKRTRFFSQAINFAQH